MKRLSWTSIAIIVGLPTLLAFVAWLIAILSNPARFCSVEVVANKVASSTISDCTSIVLQLIHWLGWTCMGLLACLCIAFLAIVVRDLNTRIDVTGFGGTHLGIGGDAAEGAKATAEAAVTKAVEIAEKAP